jgi:ADP-ribosylglycohydrolase
VKVKSGIYGLITGDAIGVPVEFLLREELDADPVTDMEGWGTHDQPPGTWSDDSSMTLATLDGLSNGSSCKEIARRFLRWCYESEYTPHGKVFDIGGTTSVALHKFARFGDHRLSGSESYNSNGNGSLMRILPFAYLKKDRGELLSLVKEAGGITHNNNLSHFCCWMYVLMARYLIEGMDKYVAYMEAVKAASEDFGGVPKELQGFVQGDVMLWPRDSIKSTGFVVHTLEAAVWTILTTTTYEDAVLRAVNLGRDTDTTGAVTGGLAGIIYGYEEIPSKWLEKLAKKDCIDEAIASFEASLD